MYQLIKKLLTQSAVKVKLTVAAKTIAVVANLSKLSAVSLRVAGAIAIQAIAVNMPKLMTASLGLSVPSKSLNGSILSSLLSKIATIALAILVVSCAASSSSSSDDAPAPVQPTEVNAFSHSSYTFAPNIPGNALIGTITSSPIGRVLTSPDRARSLVAAQLIDGIAPQYINNPTHYTTYFNITDSAASAFFNINAISGVIRFADTVAVADGNLTFDNVRGLLTDNILPIAVTININADFLKPGGTAAITRSTKVNVLNSDSYVNLATTAVLSYNLASVTNSANASSPQVRFEVSGEEKENSNTLGTAISFGLPNSDTAKSTTPVAGFGITPNSPSNAGAAQVTIFYDLRDATDPTTACGDDVFNLYLDNDATTGDLTVKSNQVFNHEQVELYRCRLTVSNNGADYFPVAFAFEDTGNVTVTGTLLTSADFNTTARISQAGGSASRGCSADEPCYYADLNLAIADIPEAPVPSLAGSTRTSLVTAFAGSFEGFNPVVAYQSASPSNYSGDLVTDEAAVDSVRINTEEEDSDQIGANQLGAGGASITAVTPAHGMSAFRIVAVDNTNSAYDLIVNTTKLDYEAFTSAELTNANAVYRIRITTTDSNNANLAATSTFDFNVKDVKFNPVFVTPDVPAAGDTADNVRRIDNAFTKEDNILNGTAGLPLYLLSGSKSFLRNFNRIGRIAAVDPETGAGAGFTYSAVPLVQNQVPNVAEQVSIGIVSNLRVIANLDATERGGRLIIAGTNLINGATGNVILQVTTADNMGTTSSAPINLTVNDDVYNISTPPISFNPAIPLVGDINEVLQPLAATAASSAVVMFNNNINPDPSAVAFSVLNPVVIADNDPVNAPFLGFVPPTFLGAISSVSPTLLADIGQLNIDLEAGQANFDINNATGEISVKAGVIFSFPAVFTLPIYVIPAGMDLATAFGTGNLDITIATIVVNDVNTPPVTFALGVPGAAPVPVTEINLQVQEGVAAGTPLASFIIADDNLPFGGVPTATLTTSANAFLRVIPTPVTAIVDGVTVTTSLVATITTIVTLDSAAIAALANVNIAISDAGSYTLFGALAGNPTMPLLRFPVATIAADNLPSTMVPLRINAPEVTDSDVIYSDPLSVAASALEQRTATITVTNTTVDDIVTAEFSGSGCVVTPATATGATSHTFTVTQGTGSVGYSNCVDVGVHTNVSGVTGGSIIMSANINGAPVAGRTYADNAILFAPAAVNLQLMADDYNIINGSIEDLPAAAADDSHIYNFLDARRWYFANDNDINSYAIYRGVAGASALATTVGDGLAYFFDTAAGGLAADGTDLATNEGVARVFFVKPAAVSTDNANMLEVNHDTTNTSQSSLAANNYDKDFFSNLTDYAVDGYLKFTTTDGASDGFVRALATSASSTRPLISIAPAENSVADRGFALKARICRISANSDNLSRMHIAALSGKALSCDAVASNELLTDSQATKIMSLVDDWDVDPGTAITTATTDAGILCENIGIDAWQAPGDATTPQSFCGGTDATGGNLTTFFESILADFPIRWSFQQYLGTRSGGAPASMAESGIYLAEVYPVPAFKTDLSVLLGKPVRVLFEVLTQ